jgi:PleD family two-component response regulator
MYYEVLFPPMARLLIYLLVIALMVSRFRPVFRRKVIGKRVLEVDDSATVRKVLHATLAEAGYDVVEVVDGADALEKLTGAPVDVLVTDLTMPNIDGINLIQFGSPNPLTRSSYSPSYAWFVRPET